MVALSVKHISVIVAWHFLSFVCPALYGADSLSTSSIARHSYHYNHPLIPVYKGSLCGYMDTLGNIVIPYRYESCGEYREELAPVRANGKYGYVDVEGYWYVKPVYDYAYPVVSGIGILVLNGKHFHAEVKGYDTPQPLYNERYTEVTVYHGNVAGAVIGKDSMVLIDKQGKRLSDVHPAIWRYDNGMFGARKIGERDSLKHRATITYLYDTAGKLVYTHNDKDGSRFIEPKGDVFAITRPTGDSTWVHVYNLNGEHIHSFRVQGIVSGLTEDGLFEVSYYDKNIANTTYSIYSTYGKLCLPIGFVSNSIDALGIDRYMVGVKGSKYHLLTDGKGKVLRDSLYSNYGNGLYFNGCLLVRHRNYNYYSVDTNGKNIFVYDDWDDHTVYGNGYIKFSVDVSGINSEKEKYRYGVASLLNPLIVKAKYNNVGFRYADVGVLILLKGKRLLYADTSGKIIHRQPIHIGKLKLDIDYKNRGAYYAHGITLPNGAGGYGESDNKAHAIYQPMLRGGVKLVAKTGEAILPKAKHKGFAYKSFGVYLANDGDTALSFAAQDSRLYIVMQAKDADGAWRDIEYVPSSWCGNSYHSMQLPKGMYWKFDAPVYKGHTKTMMRMKVDVKGNGKEVIYSNEFEGSVNPAQFWRKQGYTPSGLMDPYND